MEVGTLRRGMVWMTLGMAIPALVGWSPPHIERRVVWAPDHSQVVCTVTADGEPSERDLPTSPVTRCIHTESQEPGVAVKTPSRLWVQVATTGCVYLGTRPTHWVLLGYQNEGSVKYGWSPDGNRGGHTRVGTALPCSWPDVEREEIEGYVWKRIGEYIHQKPAVSFNPRRPWGMAGLETFAVFSVPRPWGFSSRSPYTGASLKAQVQVKSVWFHWDDGPPQVFGAEDFDSFTGYPDSVARHTYQTKTCRRPARRCHDRSGSYQIKTTFAWEGWYRVAGATKNLHIPETATTTDYPVREIVSLVVG